ncbi:MAG: putative Glutamate racemase [Candidatus Saccharibacteria bacterium]|nr:putative Glutamate racemase [Candidatus Saccharibacteria bacterium]
MKIGVFDSGVGGLSVANAIQKDVPSHEVIFKNDKTHVPYGTRDPQEILGFVIPIFESLIADGCQVIVVACNTVSTTLIFELRKRFTIPLIAIEPMIKPAAALTKTGVIAVCATPTTLASDRYAELKSSYAKDITVLEPDCSDWSNMIEHQQIEASRINQRIQRVLDANADVIVLACTHYHWIEEQISILAYGKAKVLQPESAIISELKRVLARLG